MRRHGPRLPLYNGSLSNSGRGVVSVNILAIILLVFSALLFPSISQAEEPYWFDCHSLDIVEFGLISDGSISEPWTEAQLVLKYGPPCTEVGLGEVNIERRQGRVVEIVPNGAEVQGAASGQIAAKKQLVYTGDYIDKTSVITVIDGVVVRKERIYDGE